MENQKNNSGLIALVIVLFLLVLGLGGYIIYDKVLSTKETHIEDNSTNDDKSNQEINQKNITLANLYGTYKYDYEYTNDYGNKVHLELELSLNSDGTATYLESDGYVADKTRGTYTYENNKIIYTRQYHVASNIDSANSVDTEYTDGNPTEIFTIIDENTLQNTYRDQTASLKK